MSSKRNHAIRSRKTYRARMNEARTYLNGGPPKGAASGMKFNRPGPKKRRSIGFLNALARIIQRRNREKKTAEE